MRARLFSNRRATPHFMSASRILALVALDHTAAAVCQIEAKIKVANKEAQTVTLRWLYEGTDGKVTMLPKGDGEWKLVRWGVFTFLS